MPPTTERLHWYAKAFSSNDLQVIVERMLHKQEFSQAPGATSKHHAYTGGLAEHTLEVVEYCNKANEHLELNYDILIASAIIHDWAKIYDYVLAPDPDSPGEMKWINAPYKHLVNHIAGSHAEFVRQAWGVLPSNLQVPIEHCILAHHGRQEWGSPVTPQTPEALLLHQADYWSANYGPGKEKSVYGR